MMKRFLAVLSLAMLASCGPIGPGNPPPGETIWDFSVSVDDGAGHLIPQAKVTFNGLQKEANDFGWAYFTVATGCYPIQVEKEGFDRYAPSDCQRVERHTRLAVSLAVSAPPTPRLRADGRIFRANDQPWRWKGITAFALADEYCKGHDIAPFLDQATGFNVLRVFYYWETINAVPPADDCLVNFTRLVARRGFYVEFVALTGPKPIQEAQALVDHLFQILESETNVFIELVNEPQAHEKVNPDQLHVPQTAILWTSGCYDFTISDCMRGNYGVSHNPRDNEWPRKAHDLFEYYHGAGEGASAIPPHPFPQVGDEPEKPCNPDGNCGRASTVDYEGYFGTASLLGAGGTFHFLSGEFGRLPNPQEADCLRAALRALDFYPADAPLGPYTRIDEQGATLRTYKVGAYTVRVRPVDGVTLVPY